MEPSVLCCSLFRSLSLDPVPVIGELIYIPGAEGFDLGDLREEIVKPCPSHRFNFRHTAGLLLRNASTDKPCPCKSRPSSNRFPAERENARASVEASPSPLVHGDTETPRDGKRAGGRAPSGRTVAACSKKMTLLAYEMEYVIKAYTWIAQNRSSKYPKCCDSVIAYQLTKSETLPPGLYVYRTRPSHFGCTIERPLVVIEQFNFVNESDTRGGPGKLPRVITIDMFPGRDNFSAVYVFSRKLDVPAHEYGNRLFGEASALGLIEPRYPAPVVCKHHEVAMRRERVCVIDLRWKGFETRTACFEAIPRVRGLQALVWCNHICNFQEVECKVLSWLFGLANDLPKEVQMVDYKNQVHGVRYILMDTDTFPGLMPEPPIANESFFLHTYFTGDFNVATHAIGRISGSRSRMGTPSPPSRLSLPGTRYLASPTHTLYYHAPGRQYKIMVSHTVMDNDPNLNIFRL
ncbi:hypothetical protein KUCAC02_033080 [Chaenocephalus aceratus]|nr:hypothetical protein KUCAC02_033080 [Chaenocephalus aceratus]